MQVQRPVLVAEQRQKLNPRMLQSIKILAMPVVELAEEIRAELETNPALEMIEDRSEVSLDAYEEAKRDDAEGWEDDGTDYGPSPSYESDGQEDAKRKFLEGAVALPETLQQHLLAQFRILPLSAADKELGERLIQNLDDNGFHQVKPEELCPSACSDSKLQKIMALIQGLDPAGTCTAGYKESLLVQAAMDPDAPAGVLDILGEHLDSLEKGKHAEIKKSLKLKDAQFDAAFAYIKTLSPFPGRRFSNEKTRYVVPDLAIRLEDDEFVIELNDEIIPVLGINSFFAELSKDKDKGREALAFARGNVEKAKFFIGSIRQRNATLVKVAAAVAKFQARFFREGPQAMQPLTLKDVAEEVGVHETTVSRLANGKYVQTEWGILELRRFFTNAVSSTGDKGAGTHSKEGVKATLKKILEDEANSGRAALSDRELMAILAGRGIKIARRTVAKYRGELDLDSSFSRRKK